jgi:dihydroxyacetone kinase-like predicted kinase
MTAAARGTRAGALSVAPDREITSVGVVEAGQVTGLVDGDVTVIGESLAQVGTAVLDSMLYGNEELVTLIVGKDCPAEITTALVEYVHARRPDVEVTVYDGQQPLYPVLIGVE